jgi:outer membrane biosynthesis protein TonB/tRNA A-37 threonylcarbamoyl transferase component Bud32
VTSVEMPAALRRGAPAEVSVSRTYELVGRLDQGGMGDIFLARMAGTAGFSREVVIKRLRRALAAEPRAVTAFVDEARLLASMSHPNVCQVHDLVAEEGQLYLVMEYLHGLPLGEMVKRGPIETRFLCGIAVQLCEGLHHVHSLRRPDGSPAGAIHRDISPSNLFVTSSGAAVILDFGIAKTFDSAQLTPLHVVKGKRAFMSPEQMGGEKLDARTDLYSLGVVLSDAAAPGELAEVIAKAIEILPQDRYQSAREMRAAIERAAAAVGGPAAPSDLADFLASQFAEELEARRERVNSSDPTATGTIELRAPSAERPAEMLVAPAPGVDARRRRGAIAGLTALGLIGIVVFALSSNGSADPTPAPIPTPTPTPTAIATPTPTRNPTPIPIPTPIPERTENPIPERTEIPTPPPAARTPARAPRAATGYLTIVSTPYAYITANGKDLGMTPIWRTPLRAGRVKIEAVAADGRRTAFALTVPPGSEVRHRVTWGPP